MLAEEGEAARGAEWRSESEDAANTSGEGSDAAAHDRPNDCLTMRLGPAVLNGARADCAPSRQRGENTVEPMAGAPTETNRRNRSPTWQPVPASTMGPAARRVGPGEEQSDQDRTAGRRAGAPAEAGYADRRYRRQGEASSRFEDQSDRATPTGSSPRIMLDPEVAPTAGPDRDSSAASDRAANEGRDAGLGRAPDPASAPASWIAALEAAPVVRDGTNADTIAPPSEHLGSGHSQRGNSGAETTRVRSSASTPDVRTGHRQRLRARFDAGEVLQDYELLELLLFRSVPRRDTKPLAKALIATFGSFAGTLSAPLARLEEVAGVGPAVASDFKLVREAAERFAHAELSTRETLGSTDAVVAYYRAKLRAAEREEFHILYLDKKNRFIASEKLAEGTVDHAPVYPREVLKRALHHGASAIVLVHNHPSGDPTPSRADITMTKRIIDGATPLGIAVHDHLIIAGNGFTSLRTDNLI